MSKTVKQQNKLSIKNVNKIFEIDATDNNFDLPILLKIESNKNEKMTYLSQCFTRSLKYNISYTNFTFKYITLVITGALDEEDVEEFEIWLCKNKFDGLTYLFDNFDSIFQNQKMIDYYYKIIDLNCSDSQIKLYNIGKIFESSQACKILCIKPHVNNCTEENKGVLSWMKETNFECVFNIIKTISNDENKMANFLARIDTILNNNKYYLRENFEFNNSLSTMHFLCKIFKSLLKLCETKNNYDLKNLNSVRNDYRKEKNDNIDTQLILTTCRMFVFCCNNQIYLHNQLKNNKLISRLHDKNILNKITKDEEYQKLINNFILSYIKNDIHVNDDFAQDLILYCGNKMLYDSYYDFDMPIIDYLLDIAQGKLNNPHIRHFALIQLIDIIDVKGFLQKHEKIVVTFIKYINEVNFYEYLDTNKCHIHLRNILGKITSICQTLNNNKVIISQKNMETIYLNIHKLAYKTNYYLDDNNTYSNYIEKEKKRNAQKKLIVFSIVSDNLVTINIILTAIMSIINDIVKDINKLNKELIIPLNTGIIQIFKYFSNTKNPLYNFLMQDRESNEIIINILNIMNILKENKYFHEQIQEYKTDLLVILKKINLNADRKKELRKYLKNLQDKNNMEIPEEFLDPILLNEITDPVMIPNVDLVFDKSTIMTQLYNEQINPYTREPLTQSQVEEYNKNDQVIQKIREFTDNYNKWKQDTK